MTPNHPHFRPRWLPLVGLPVLLIGGCNPRTTELNNQPPARTTPDPSTHAGDVTLTTVKFDGLDRFLKEQRGKVVVMDVWADWCSTCKKEFPGLVELHDRYGKDGLVCVSVTVDLPDKADQSLKFLRQQKAVFTNFLLDEKDDDWMKRYHVTGLPLMVVFDRDGKVVKQFDTETPGFTPNYKDDIEPVVRKQLGPSEPKK